MSNFDLLHPALQHHIVNSLGWRSLRPFQDEVIPPLLAGAHQIVLAPTAGGKTEAATFPVLSRMLSEDWRGLSVIYVCPIKALLNNLETRLTTYCELLGRRVALRHGDVTASARRRIVQDPPDLLLTTPESLEVMLVSTRVDEEVLFGNLRAVIIDEIHAFAGDDRGWHLLSVLDRVTKLAGHPVQRIGLSATVGNPRALCDWLAGACPGPRGVHAPEVNPARPAPAPAADVAIDFVGSLENAATVISRLHRGEKRLVFCESRARAEAIGTELDRLGTTTFVTHSSLSVTERRAAEDAFANRENCVIVATSVLELGIDVGDLDRVIQIDSPARVASFLQRMGRTGRRPGTTRNCLFLATTPTALLQAAALVDLWREGFVEPVVPPPGPRHVFAQQLLTLVLQEQGLGRSAWRDWIGRMPGFAALPPGDLEQVIDHMLAERILFEDHGILAIDEVGERRYGWRHYMEVMSVFLSPPLLSVLHGRTDLGQVDASTLVPKAKDRPIILSLAARSWLVRSIDWPRGMVSVEPTTDPGLSRWRSNGPGLSFALCQRMRRLLADRSDLEGWSTRARDAMHEARTEFPWVSADATVMVNERHHDLKWWTFAGRAANAGIASALRRRIPGAVTFDNLSVTIDDGLGIDTLDEILAALPALGDDDFLPEIDTDAIEALKFSDCLPRDMATRMLQVRSSDLPAIRAALAEPLRRVTAAE
ncbi:MAG: DEAD/DEAH box helicase [Planctomycetia bacterium]|nr:DEAD/DEAH box helicase [Planctomycetia bacterium]